MANDCHDAAPRFLNVCLSPMFLYFGVDYSVAKVFCELRP